ncbi:MAG: C4-dicarboxylate ABC transporter permease [Chloroflexi bacterium RBG_13_54_9]|nr:MAG: C4-dicarboxylate ABC transporter permease [Chloroflexi bacterium RBG_13_54_9]
MTPVEVGIIGLSLMVVLMFLGMPIGFSMGLVGFAGFAYLNSLDSALSLLGLVPYRTFSDYGFSVIPLFMLMGTFSFVAGISSDLYNTAQKFMGRVPGGLAMASIAACAAFGAICGSSTATGATMAVVALPEMKKVRYNSGFATATIAVGGTLGIMIPPSLTFMIYGIIAQQSIGKLFIAGIFPGIVAALLLIGTISILCHVNPLLGPPGSRTTFIEKIVSLKNVWIMLLIFIIVIGGLYVGFFSPTEAAGVGCFCTFVFALVRRRLSWKGFLESIYETVRISSMCFVIVAGAIIFSYFLTLSRLPAELSAAIGGGWNRYVALGAILVIYLFLGCLMDTIAMILLTVPIFLPLVSAYGFDPIWFGVIVTLMAEIGLITPPVGMNVFVISGIAKDVPMYSTFRAIGYLLIPMLILVVLLIAFPQIALFLPATMK